MIRLRLNSPDDDRPPLYMLGLTDINVERLTAGKPITVDLRDIGGNDVVAIFHGGDAHALLEQLREILSPKELDVVRAGLDQLEAAEREIREGG